MKTQIQKDIEKHPVIYSHDDWGRVWKHTFSVRRLSKQNAVALGETHKVSVEALCESNSHHNHDKQLKDRHFYGIGAGGRSFIGDDEGAKEFYDKLRSKSFVPYQIFPEKVALVGISREHLETIVRSLTEHKDTQTPDSWKENTQKAIDEVEAAISKAYGHFTRPN